MPTHKFIGLMSKKSHVEPLGVFFLDPSKNDGLEIIRSPIVISLITFNTIIYGWIQFCTDMKKIGGIVNEYAPVADRHTGERRKVCNQGDQGNIVPGKSFSQAEVSISPPP